MTDSDGRPVGLVVGGFCGHPEHATPPDELYDDVREHGWTVQPTSCAVCGKVEA